MTEGSVHYPHTCRRKGDLGYLKPRQTKHRELWNSLRAKVHYKFFIFLEQWEREPELKNGVYS